MRICKICSSPRRREVDAKLGLGDPVREISMWLQESGEDISASAVGRHEKNHFRPAAAATARAAAEGTAAATLPGASEPEVQALAEKIVSSAAALEELVVLAMRTVRRLHHRFTTDGTRTATTAEAAAFVGSLRAATDAIIAREELLTGGKKLKVATEGPGGLAGLYAALERERAHSRDEAEESGPLPT